MYYCEYAHLLKKCTEHTCMSAIYYDQGSDIKVKQCKTIVTYHILNRLELCECSLTAGNYLLSYMNINCGNAPEARDGYFTTYYSFNKIVLDIITEKFDIQVDENTRNQAALLHDDIPGYDLPTIDFVQTTTYQDKDVSILEEDNLQIYAHLDNVLVHMIDNQQTAIFKLNQDFNENKKKISQYIKHAENWQVASVICSYMAMACDVQLITAMIVFLLKYHKTMQAMPIARKDVSQVFEIEYTTYRIINRSELCECSLTTGNYLLSYTNINCGNTPEARDGYFTTYYSFNKKSTSR